MRDAMADLGFALRSLRRRPALALVCVLTIAVAIGATTIVSSLAWGLVYEPLDYPEAEHLADVWPELWWSKKLYVRLRAESTSYEELALWSASANRLVDEAGGRLVPTAQVTASFFPSLRRSVALGRDLEASDERPASDVVLLTAEGVRRHAAGSAREALGRRLDLDGRSVEVVGVLPAGLDVLQRDAELVRPLELDPSGTDWEDRYLHVVGRLRDGVTLEMAAAELERLAHSWAAEHGFGEEAIASADVVPLANALGRRSRPAMRLLLAAVGCVLLLAAANIANLLLARALEREREVRLRAALGARPGRLLREAWAEAAWLAGAGGGLGLLLAVAGLPAAISLLPAETPHLGRVALDGFALLVSLCATLLVALLVGALPALHAWRTNLRPVGMSVAGGAARARSALVVCEVTLAVALTVAAGLLAKSFLHTMRADLGVRTNGLLTFLHVPESSRFESPTALESYYRDLRQRLGALPGVVGVAEVHALPVQNPGWTMGISPAGEPPASGEERRLGSWRPVSDSYFEALSVPLLRGRSFDARDGTLAPPVGILNNSGARLLFPGRDAVGQRVEMPWDTGEPIEIVGVVADVKLGGARAGVPITLYRPYAQAVVKTHAMQLVWRTLALRVTGEPRGLEPVLRAAVRAFDPRAAIDRLQTMEDVVAEDRAGPRMLAVLVGLFAGTGALLGAVGIYGVLECQVRDRRRELAIRSALGASRRAVRGLVVRRSVALTVAGAIAGAALALLAGRLLEGALFEVSARDPVVYAVALAAAIAVALLAAWWPARRAGATDPAELLRGA